MLIFRQIESRTNTTRVSDLTLREGPLDCSEPTKLITISPGSGRIHTRSWFHMSCYNIFTSQEISFTIPISSINYPKLRDIGFYSQLCRGDIFNPPVPVTLLLLNNVAKCININPSTQVSLECRFNLAIAPSRSRRYLYITYLAKAYKHLRSRPSTRAPSLTQGFYQHGNLDTDWPYALRPRNSRLLTATSFASI